MKQVRQRYPFWAHMAGSFCMGIFDCIGNGDAILAVVSGGLFLGAIVFWHRFERGWADVK